MPHPDKIASKTRILFAELLSTFCTVRTATRSSKRTILKTLTIEIKIADDPTVMQAKTEQIILKYRKAARYLKSGSCFDIIEAKMDDFRTTIIEKELEKLAHEIAEGERRRGQWDDSKILVDNTAPPQSSLDGLDIQINAVVEEINDRYGTCQIQSLEHVLMLPMVQVPAPLFRKVYIDTMHMPPSYGYKYIVQARDSLTGWAE
ncbi:hypothetical protein AN958_07300 [Leucoagaricus sp. SymC.cos]|nr:hypothetical protein AN958_07300 [Leucoagaricus sp. SymC.cos]